MSSDTNGFRVNENESNGLQVSHSNQLANRPLDADIPKPSIEEVDKLADQLAAEFHNPGYRQWYCKVIYEFGIARVLYWHKRATGEGVRDPSKLFGYYVKQARTAPQANDSTRTDTHMIVKPTGDNFDHPPTPDEVGKYFPDDEDETIPV